MKRKDMTLKESQEAVRASPQYRAAVNKILEEIKRKEQTDILFAADMIILSKRQ